MDPSMVQTPVRHARLFHPRTASHVRLGGCYALSPYTASRLSSLVACTDMLRAGQFVYTPSTHPTHQTRPTHPARPTHLLNLYAPSQRWVSIGVGSVEHGGRTGRIGRMGSRGRRVGRVGRVGSRGREGCTGRARFGGLRRVGRFGACRVYWCVACGACRPWRVEGV